MDLRKKTPVKLNDDFSSTLKLLENSDESFFITGSAGTGKSTLLRLFVETTSKKTVVLAPTGIAALNVRGQTIHSFFKLPPNFIPKTAIKISKNSRIYKNLDTIIIDEISMVRADLLDNIDLFLRINRKSPLPFGGVQMIFFGDLFQIPPVVSTEFEKKYLQENYETPYFFSANSIQNENFNLNFIELNQIFRQTNRNFINLLESIRTNQMDWDLLEELNERYNPKEYKEGLYITLSARNANVEKLNKEKLDELPGKEYNYPANIIGDFPRNTYPTNYDLSLKVGAQVMFLKNDSEKRYVNGTIGKVINLDIDKIEVELSNDGKKEIVDVEYEEWDYVKYFTDFKNPNNIEQEVIGTFQQYPLKLAWAITIHKSQGKTFQNVIIDMGAKGAFAHGQTYVALSRCTSLEGIILKTPIKPGDIMVDPRILDYLENKKRYG
ncbi:MAG TPA: AAA family ATPase [Bacteroidetes bacterium]|nr:AAA family ATPase [Bacteroidota bacterium]